jgi:hypothetical protein
MADLTAVNPYTSLTDRLLVRMADQAGMKALHMFTAGDPARNATFVYFGDPDYFLTDFPSSTCETCINPAFAWNHGDIQPEIANTWLGFVGPGVRRDGIRGDVWSDHTDVRPTMLSLVGLADPYVHDGRVLIETLNDSAVAQNLRAHRATLLFLGAIYKQLNAPFGAFGQSSLRVSTTALASGDDSSDATYSAYEGTIGGWTSRRDTLASQMKAMLAAAAFGGTSLDERQAQGLIAQGAALLAEAALFAARVPAP